ncbi:hypothetical protein ACFWAP_12225 [Streptomyces goshikiensis]|uniref:hypothetical protein n=1 Tax=Streptomyces goshikiensis TaxID=1942 RepID=UPI00364F0025
MPSSSTTTAPTGERPPRPPADLAPYAEDAYAHPRYADAQNPPDDSDTEQDAVVVLNARAHAGCPLSADFLAESLGWGTGRVAGALEHAWAHPDLGGPYALRRAAPAHFTLGPRLDVLTDRQMNRLHPLDHTDLRRPEDPDYRPLQRDVLSEADARVLYDARNGEILHNGIEGSTVAGLVDAGLLVTVGDDTAALADDVQYSLRFMTSDGVNPTDTPHVVDH